MNPLLLTYNETKLTNEDVYKKYKPNPKNAMDKKLQKMMQKFYDFENEIEDEF